MIYLLFILFVISIEGMQPKKPRPPFNFAQAFPCEARKIGVLIESAQKQKFTQENLDTLSDQGLYVRPPQDANGNTMLHNMALNALSMNEEMFRFNLYMVFTHYHWYLSLKNSIGLSAWQIAKRYPCSNNDFFVQCFEMAQKWQALEGLLDRPESFNRFLEDYLKKLPFNAKNFQGYNILQLLMQKYRWRRYSASALQKRLQVILSHVDPDDKGPDNQTPWQIAVKGWRTSDSENTDNLDEVVKQELLRHNMAMVLQSNKK